MFKVFFETTGQRVGYLIDKPNKKMWLYSQKTNYEWKEKHWSYLSDKGIYWAEPKDKYKTGLKKIPLKIEKLKRSALLRNMHSLNILQVSQIANENIKQTPKLMKQIDLMNEQELKQHIIKHMEDIGYKYVDTKHTEPSA